jgi:hypothetical protein
VGWVILAFISPAIVTLIASIAMLSTPVNLAKPTLRQLITQGSNGAAITLVAVIGWAVWRQITTGYGADHALLQWLFFYGPVGFAAGQVIAVVRWWLSDAT